jgi:hypothetical protein
MFPVPEASVPAVEICSERSDGNKTTKLQLRNVHEMKTVM